MSEPAAPAGMTRARRWSIRGVVALASVVFLASVLSIWVDRLALNTDVYVATSDQILQDPTVRTALSQNLVHQLYANVDVSAQIEQVLPERAKPLAGAAAAALQPYAVKGANELLATPPASCGRPQTATPTSGSSCLSPRETTGWRLSSENGAVTLNLQPLLDALEGRLGEGRLPPAAPAQPRRGADRDSPVRSAEHGADDRAVAQERVRVPLDRGAGARRRWPSIWPRRAALGGAAVRFGLIGAASC